MSKLKFVCPKCGGGRVECIQDGYHSCEALFIEEDGFCMAHFNRPKTIPCSFHPKFLNAVSTIERHSRLRLEEIKARVQAMLDEDRNKIDQEQE